MSTVETPPALPVPGPAVPVATAATAPVVPGFHPDPSVCRRGGDYYLIASSFEYFPAVPIFHSTDLLRWEQIGNVLDRPSQFTPGRGTSRGIYASTIRHHDGLFWVVTTDVSSEQPGQFLVTATDPAGPWSDPVRVPGTPGIDPDLAWDETGRCLLTWCTPDDGRGGPGSIVQAALDPRTGTLLETPRRLWSGTGLAFPEAPHVVRRGDWWYLVIAEGGTERGHCVSVARSRRATGPFEGNPANPVLTRRSTPHPVQNTGHADLVQTPDGRWAAVHLGVRPRGTTPMFHVNGRETFLAAVTWEQDWPVLHEDPRALPPVDRSFTDDLRGPRLHPRWVCPDGDPADLLRRDGRGVGFAAPGGPGRWSGLLATRVLDEHWRAEFVVDPGPGGVEAVVHLDPRHAYAVAVDAGGVRARAVVGDLTSATAPVARTGTGPLTLTLESRPATGGGPDDLHLGFADAAGDHVLARWDGRYLSTEVAGGFTGRVVGVRADGAGARVHRVRYLSR